MASNFSIKLIFSDSNIIYDKNSGLDMVSPHSETTADTVLPNYGIISRSGKVSFFDYEDKLLNKKTDREYPTEIEIYENGVLFGKYISTKKYGYNIFTKQVNIELQGNITNWQAIRVEKKDISYDQTAYQILEWLIAKQTIVSSISDLNMSTDVADFLKSITVPYFYLESDTLWEQFNKLCNLAQLRIYQDKFNKVTIERYQ